MSNHIEHPDAYARSIKARMRRNAVVGRLQRLPEEQPDVLRLMAAINAERYRVQHARWVRVNDKEPGEYLEPKPETSVFIRTDANRADTGVSWIVSLEWEEVRDFDFPESLVLGYLKSGRLSEKQAAWVTKLADELPQRAAQLEAKLAAEAAANAGSEFVGTVKERRDFTVTVDALINIESAQYGSKLLVKMHDADGNVFATFTTSEWAYIVKKGETLTIKGTVKAHEVYQGTKQTTLTRTKGPATHTWAAQDAAREATR